MHLELASGHVLWICEYGLWASGADRWSSRDGLRTDNCRWLLKLGDNSLWTPEEAVHDTSKVEDTSLFET